MFCRIIPRKRKSGSVPVYLNVYDLTPINEYAYWLGLGVYHSGVQVHDIEYAFGAHEQATTGIFEAEPRQCPGFTFRKSILIGKTDMCAKDVRVFMEKLALNYSGNSYNLITKNCNHFCNDACLGIAGKSIPRWVNRLARLGLFCNCVLPAGLNETKIRQHVRAVDKVMGAAETKKKLRSHSSRFAAASNNNNNDNRPWMPPPLSSSNPATKSRRQRRYLPPSPPLSRTCSTPPQIMKDTASATPIF